MDQAPIFQQHEIDYHQKVNHKVSCFVQLLGRPCNGTKSNPNHGLEHGKKAKDHQNPPSSTIQPKSWCAKQRSKFALVCIYCVQSAVGQPMLLLLHRKFVSGNFVREFLTVRRKSGRNFLQQIFRTMFSCKSIRIDFRREPKFNTGKVTSGIMPLGIMRSSYKTNSPRLVFQQGLSEKLRNN